MSNPSLVILGNGKLFLQPDVALISLPILAIEVGYSESIESLNLKNNSLLAIIERNGISKDSLTTSDFNISENWKYYTDKRRKPKLTGFTARHDMTLEIPIDNKLISSILNDISKEEIGIEFSIGFGVSDKDKYNKELLKLAFLNAKEAADVVSAASGTKLKRILKIDVRNNPSDHYEMDDEYSFSNLHTIDSCFSAQMIDIKPKDVEATQTVKVVWEIE